MNLFWKKFFGRLMPTDKYEKQEVDFLTISEKLKSLKYSQALAEYKQLYLSSKFVSVETRKQQQNRLAELKKHPDVAFFLKNGAKRNTPIRDATLTFSDDFYWKKPEDSRWNHGFYFSNEKLIRNYSFHNEKQANNAGNNTLVNAGVLQIQTRREAIKSLAWHPVRGFAEKQFAYTSDVLQSAKNFRQEGGIFKAKIRCSGNIHHAFWLATEKKEPHINIFHYNGSEIQMGFMNRQQGDGIIIKGINPAAYYIYSMEWTKDELTWYINNLAVFRTKNNIPKEQMFLVFNSFIPEKMTGEEGLLEVDWVRVYQWL
ncbi:MAG: glycoside hydrolase family 16 protein [Paludibacter sp.]|nr:glycoside hydrolase family 16 protein [Paludibacter sp.]MDD4198228.1 glycoside hydrolase family 16 protein [Paludibacter sp.]MDD4427301.1 glycoside hydrolase family 16 protein [Paludibacter sp.]